MDKNKGTEFRLLVFILTLSCVGADNLEIGTCEPIKVDMCKHIGYNKTAMPNFAGQTAQADADEELATYVPLIQSGCANEIQFFLCFAFVPMCVTEVTTPQRVIGPCRPLCERVRKRCLPALEKYKYSWPSTLNCSKFPESNNHYHMCMEGPGESHIPRLPPTPLHTLQTNPLFMQKVKQQVAEGNKPDLPEKYQKNYLQLLETSFDKQKPAKGINILCSRFKKSSLYHYIAKQSKQDSCNNCCVPMCQEDIIFTKEEKNFGHGLILGLSISGLIVSFLVFLTLLIDGSLDARTLSDLVRKSSLFLSLSCTGLCGAYLLSRFFSAKDLCIVSDEDPKILLVAQEGHRNQPCTVIFLFLYFFGTAVVHWFTATLVTWCLSSTKSSHSFFSLPTLSSLTHAYSWGLPAIFTIVAIVSYQVESDEYSSVCLPGGSHNDLSFLIFIVLPQGVQFILGTFFTLSGIVLSLIKLNEKSPPQTHARKKPTQLHLRSWTMNYIIFSLVFVLSMGCVWGIHVYEYRYRSLWYDGSQVFMPDSQMFSFRIFMTFLMAMSPAILIINRDAFFAWRKLLCDSCLLQFWNRDKQKTPDFPRVAYQPQAVVLENQVHIGHDYLRGQNL